MQGPFGGVAGALSRVFGGTVTIHHGTGAARDVRAIFRLSPRMIDASNDAQIETLVPTLRGSKADLADLVEGALVDPMDGEIYAALFAEQSPSPASDALITWQLEVVT
jgi:hypothetical protein